MPKTETSDDSDYKPYKSTGDKLIEIWKKGQKIFDMFWEEWRKEYLASLRERTQTKLKSGRVTSQFQPNVKDVVLIKDNTSRGNWKIGKVCKLIKAMMERFDRQSRCFFGKRNRSAA